MHPRVKNILGERFGRLVVCSQAASRPGARSRWNCRCQCGNTVVVDGSNLRQGFTQSCGCLQVERSRDASVSAAIWGLPEFNVWRSMLRRCNNPKAKGYLGGGIKMEFADFHDFIRAAGERPSPKHRLFRIDQDRNFCADNVVWMLPKEHHKMFPEYYANLRRRG